MAAAPCLLLMHVLTDMAAASCLLLTHALKDMIHDSSILPTADACTYRHACVLGMRHQPQVHTSTAAYR